MAQWKGKLTLHLAHDKLARPAMPAVSRCIPQAAAASLLVRESLGSIFIPKRIEAEDVATYNTR